MINSMLTKLDLVEPRPPFETSSSTLPALIWRCTSKKAGETNSESLQVVNDLHLPGTVLVLVQPFEIVLQAELRAARAVSVVQTALGVLLAPGLRARNRVIKCFFALIIQQGLPGCKTQRQGQSCHGGRVRADNDRGTIFVGDAAAGIVQQMCIRDRLLRHPDCHAVVLRRVNKTLRTSVYAQVCWAIGALGLSAKFKCTVSPMECTYLPTGQKIFFFGLDDPGKLKSLKAPHGYIGLLWFEELDQFDGPEQVRNVEQSCLRGGPYSFTFKSFNPPPSARNWANRYAREAVSYTHLTPSNSALTFF